MKGKHILIYGERGSGKTDIIDRITEQCTVPVYGFCTRIVKDREDGDHEIYIYPAGRADGHMSSENYVAACNTKDRTVNLEAFRILGMKYLEAAEDGIVIMDEIGYGRSCPGILPGGACSSRRRYTCTGLRKRRQTV